MTGADVKREARCDPAIFFQNTHVPDIIRGEKVCRGDMKKEMEANYSPEKKTGILRKYLVERIDAQTICEEYGVDEGNLKQWTEQLLAGAPDIFRMQIGDIELLEYTRWEERPLEDPREIKPEEIKDALIEIIDVEGPMKAVNAYRTYVKAAGISKVGGKIRAIFNAILQEAIADELLIMRDEGDEPEYAERVVRVITENPVVPRTLGPRGIDDVPPAELATVMRHCLWKEPRQDNESLFRKVLGLYGLKVLTRKAQDTMERIRELYADKFDSEEEL